MPCPTPSPRHHADSLKATLWPLEGSCASSMVVSPLPTTSPPLLQRTKFLSRAAKYNIMLLPKRSSLLFPHFSCFVLFCFWFGFYKHPVLSCTRVKWKVKYMPVVWFVAIAEKNMWKLVSMYHSNLRCMLECFIQVYHILEHINIIIQFLHLTKTFFPWASSAQRSARLSILHWIPAVRMDGYHLSFFMHSWQSCCSSVAEFIGPTSQTPEPPNV